MGGQTQRYTRIPIHIGGQAPICLAKLHTYLQYTITSSIHIYYTSVRAYPQCNLRTELANTDK